MTAPASDGRRLTPFDGVGLAAGAIVWLLTGVLVFRVAPVYARMFADFGGPLPGYTQLWLRPVPALLVAAIPLAAVADGLVRRASDSSRIIRMTIAIGAIPLVIGAFLLGMYLPVFAVAANVQ